MFNKSFTTDGTMETLKLSGMKNSAGILNGKQYTLCYSRRSTDLVLYYSGPLYNGIRYNSKIRYNVNPICTKISVL